MKNSSPKAISAKELSDPVKRLLQGFSVDEIVTSPNICCVLDADLRLVYFNGAFLRGADDRGAADLCERFGRGTSILDAISGPQRKYYEELFTTALQSEDRMTNDYECSSADRYQEYQMIVYPLANGAGLLLEHALKLSQEHDRNAVSFDPQRYVDSNGIVHQCGHCRRVKDIEKQTYDWCPDAFDANNVSHGLCSSCLDFYYPDI